MRCGRDCLIASGLCGTLRAWQASPTAVAILSPTGARSVVVRVLVAPSEAREWKLVLNESSIYPIANQRTSSHPYRFISPLTDDKRFATATSSDEGAVEIWCARAWVRLQKLDVAEAEGPRSEWIARGLRRVGSSCSCLALTPSHLACGTREGRVHVWRGGRENGMRHHLRGLTADVGALGSVQLTTALVLAAYCQKSGFVDGDSFCGEQSVVAWKLCSGQLLWRVKSHASSPLIGTLLCGEQLWCMHAHPALSEPEWNLLFASEVPRPTNTGKEGREGSNRQGASTHTHPTVVCARAAPLLCEEEAEKSCWHEVEAREALLCWHSDGGEIGMGFCGGLVMLVLSAARGEHSRVVRARAAGGADVGAVLVRGGAKDGGAMRGDARSGKAEVLNESGTIVGMDGLIGVGQVVEPGAMAGRAGEWAKIKASAHRDGEPGADLFSASACGSVRLWSLAHHGDKSSLEQTGVVQLAAGLQPCALGMMSEGTLLCGCTDGSILGVSEGLLVSGVADDILSPYLHSYEWSFDSGTGVAGHGLVREKRRVFDGWARTAAYERGLQEVLSKMKQPKSSEQSHVSTKTTTTQEPSVPSRGTLYRLDGLQARPELNGYVVVVIAEIDKMSGRVPVRILPSVHELAPEKRSHTGDLKVRPYNLVRLKPEEKLAFAPRT
ncbi:MAG: hypothetical protein SGPRY_005828 [Prymnesium sp.]